MRKRKLKKNIEQKNENSNSEVEDNNIHFNEEEYHS
jgi:hypothetical protein